MEPRLDYMAAAPDAMKPLIALEQSVSQNSGLDKRLVHLIKLRASHINGCAYCIDMHVKEARFDGCSEQWIALIPAWQESPLYSDCERAVLAWTEAVTKVSETGAPDTDFDPLRAHFSDEEIIKLTMVVGMINFWNRLAVGFRTPHEIDQTN